MKSSQFMNKGLSFNYYQTGEGLADIFLQHGVYDDGLCWGNLPQDLGKNYRVTSMDARGFGLSSKPENGYDMDTMSEDMAALIKHLNLNQPIVIGHSMGASLALHLAALYPDLLSGVVLIDPAFREPASQEDKDDLNSKRSTDLLEQQAMTRDQLIASNWAKHPTWPEEFILSSADSKYRMSLKALAIFNTIDATWKEDLKIARCPILLLTAETELGAIVSKETAAFACAANSHVKSLFISGAGHSIHREKYAEVINSIDNFLIQIK